jgi:hypothetical protein
MRSRKIIFIAFIIAMNILASCSSAIVNSSNLSLLPDRITQSEDIQKYFNYQEFSALSIERLEQNLLNPSLNTSEIRDIQKLRNNLIKIASHENFTINVKNTNPHSFELMELVYSLGLPINIKWNRSDKNREISKDLVSKKISGFCSSIYKDAATSIANAIKISNNSTLVIFMPKYNDVHQLLLEQFPNIKSIIFNQTDVQKFSSEILGINHSNTRFNKIKNLNPNQMLKFFPRARDDIKTIVLLIEPGQYQSILPGLRYHGGDKFQYINFISSLENLDTSNQLLDFENSLTPFPFHLSKRVQTKEISSLENVIQRSALNDWLLIEIIRQSGIRSAEISGMTGDLDYQRGSCTKRSIPMQLINSKWITS